MNTLRCHTRNHFHRMQIIHYLLQEEVTNGGLGKMTRRSKVDPGLAG